MPYLVYHPDFLKHAPGNWPESPERLQAVVDRFDQAGVKDLVQPLAPRPATDEELRLVHYPDYIDTLRDLAQRGGGHLDADTVVSRHSHAVASMAAGGCLAAVDSVLASTGPTTALCLVRPPGHHALPGRGMGFCLFNNVALAASHAIVAHGLQRVLIVDWDLHHGNGTEAIFQSRKDVLYFSLHQSPCYPGTGWLTETGTGAGEGYTVNLPLPPGSGDAAYQRAFEHLLLPIATDYKPELILVSSGHDAHFADPLGSMRVTARGFRILTSILVQLARDTATGRLIAVMEGGYNEAALSWSLLAVLDALGDLGLTLEDVAGAPTPGSEPPEALQRLDQARRIHNEAWQSLA